MKTKIKVLQSDISKGVQGEGHKCMIARAVKRMIHPKFRSMVGVGYGSFSINTPTGKWFNNKFSDRISTKIKTFDRNRELVKPFSFTVNIPKEFINCSKPKKTNETTQPQHTNSL